MVLMISHRYRQQQRIKIQLNLMMRTREIQVYCLQTIPINIVWEQTHSWSIVIQK